MLRDKKYPLVMNASCEGSRVIEEKCVTLNLMSSCFGIFFESLIKRDEEPVLCQIPFLMS